MILKGFALVRRPYRGRCQFLKELVCCCRLIFLSQLFRFDTEVDCFRIDLFGFGTFRRTFRELWNPNSGSFSGLEVLGEVSGDLPEDLQGALGFNLGPSVLPREPEGFSGRSPESSPSTSDLEKSCSGLGKSMIFKIDEKKMNEQEKQK